MGFQPMRQYLIICSLLGKFADIFKINNLLNYKKFNKYRVNWISETQLIQKWIKTITFYFYIFLPVNKTNKPDKL